MTNVPASVFDPTTSPNPCALLSKLYEAYFALASGTQTAEVRDINRVITFQRGSVPALERAIKALEYRCPATSLNLFPRPMAIRAGPYTDIPGFHGGLVRRPR